MWLVDIILLCFTIHFSLQIIKTYGARTILLVYIFITFAQQILSIMYLNTGVFVYELNRTTYYVPESTPLFIFYTNFFLFFVYIFGRRYQKNFNYSDIEELSKVSRIMCYGSVAFSVALAAYTLLDLVVSGIPIFVAAITHYNFYSTYSTLPFASTVNNWLSISMYFLGYAYVHIKKKGFRVTCVLIVILSMLIRFIMSYRMSGLINIPLNFLAVAFLLSKTNFKNIRQILTPKRVFRISLALILVLLAFIISSIVSGRASDISEAIEVFANRAFGLGNHLWWAAEADNSTGNDLFVHNLLNEFLVIFTGGNQYDTNSGVYYLMRQYGYSYIVNVDINHGIRYAATFITTVVYKWGYILCIFPIAIIARVLVWFINNFDRTVKKDHIVQFVLICKLLGTFSTYITSTGTLAEWMNPENYIYLILFILARYGFKKRSMIRKPISGGRRI